jgi:hypothetical protein
MPEVSRFHGIKIRMYYSEHEAPHFHARYGEHKLTVRLSDGAFTGRFPPRVRRQVLSWYASKRTDLWQNWWRLRARQPARWIPPTI